MEMIRAQQLQSDLNEPAIGVGDMLLEALGPSQVTTVMPCSRQQHATENNTAKILQVNYLLLESTSHRAS